MANRTNDPFNLSLKGNSVQGTRPTSARNNSQTKQTVISARTGE